MTTQAPPAEAGPTARVLPPVVEVTVGALVLAIVGGIYMASYFPHRPPLGIPIGLLVAGALLLGAGCGMLVRIQDFGWRSFRLVGFWTLIAYILQGGMIGYAFVHNGASGAPLVVIMLLLVIFATGVPLIVSFTVGRYQTD
jgi:hypothetical protein